VIKKLGKRGLSYFSILLFIGKLEAGVVIHEVQSTNTSLPDPFNQLIDWVEIYNSDSASFDLSGHYLSDSTSSRTKYQFPSGTTIGPGGYLIVWCGQSTEFTTSGPYPAGQLRATGFAISSGGEPIVLTAPDGLTTIDEYPGLPIGTVGTVGRSLGRGTGSNFSVLYFYNTPTRGSANTTTGTEAIPLDSPTVSLPGGVYSSGQTVSLSTSLSNGIIRYSLDGSEPTDSSPVYSEPISLGMGGNNSTQYSWVPTAPAGSGIDEWRQPNGSVARIHVLRARIFQEGRSSRTITKSYLIDPAGTNRYAFPIVSIASDPANLFNNKRGIYVSGTNTYSTDWPNTPGAVPSEFWANYYQSGSEWERSSSLEFFERNGAQLLEGAVGLRINGNTTRNRPRKALRIYNRNPSGSTTWTNTALFPDRDTRSWSTFLLRAAGNDWNQSLFRDALVSSIAAPTGLDRQAARPAVLFLNGEYWGIHNLRERIDEDWVFHKYGLSGSQVAVLEVTSGGANFLNPNSNDSQPILDFGNAALLADYKDILSRAGNNEFLSESGYLNLGARIDVNNFIDYSAVTIWSGNTDWPGNNVLMWRSLASSPTTNSRIDGRWRYIIKDNDFALGLNLNYVPGYDSDITRMAEFDTLSYATTSSATTWANNEISTRLLRKALENTTFRNQFINRFADLLNTTLSASAATEKLDEHIAAYQPGVSEHFSRWPTSLTWSNEVARIRGYLQARPAAVRGHIANKFGLTGMVNLTVSVTNTNQGFVSVNSLKIESSTAGIGTNIVNWSGTYFKGIPVALQAGARPGYRFSGWSKSVASSDTVHAFDAASSYSNWSDGSNLGSGFEPWWFWTTAENSGQAGTFLQNSRGGWGCYANSGKTIYVGRPLTQPLTQGKTLVTRIKHGTVASPGSVGVILENSSQETIFQFERRFSSDVYWVNGQSTGVPVTTASIDLEISPTLGSNFAVIITPSGGSASNLTGTFLGSGLREASNFIFYNNSAGFGGGADFFITSMRITTPGSTIGGSFSSYGTNPVLSETFSGDAIYRASFVVEPATTLAIVPPAVGAAGTPLGAIQVRAVNSTGDADGNYQSAVTLTVTSSSGSSQTYTSTAVNGVASFAGLILPAAGSYSLTATSGSLSAAPLASLNVNATAVFLPTNSAVWQVPTNWDTGTIPNGTRAAVTIPASLTGPRNITNSAPLTVSSIHFSNSTSTNQNKINGTAGQVLAFQSEGGTSSVTVTGSGIGYGNIDVAGGVVLSNALVLDVQNIATTNTEYGALRLQGNWSGPGKIIKRGPGIAGITGGGKTFSGDIVVEQGVLTFSEPAISGNNVTNYTVQSGGQLRLSSSGNPRNYLLKGPLLLAGSGRSGVSDNENQGILGALRLETGSTGTVAVLTNRVELTANADIHVPAINNITLQGALVGNATLSKSGGGTLQLNPGTGTFAGSIQVNRGTLHLGGAQLTHLLSINLTNEATLAGSGAIAGALTLQTGAVLESSQGPVPGTAPLAVGGFAVQGAAILNLKFSGTPIAGRYPILTSGNGITGLDQLTIMGAPTNFVASRVVQESGTVSIILAENDFQVWLVEQGISPHGTMAEAWSADLDGNGWTSGQEYAFGLNHPLSQRTMIQAVPAEVGSNSVRFTFLKRIGLSYVILSTTDLSSGLSTPTSSAKTDPQPSGLPEGYEQHEVLLPTQPGRGFFQIRAGP
jgi:autotransporter-associated beta strand protein